VTIGRQCVGFHSRYMSCRIRFLDEVILKERSSAKSANQLRDITVNSNRLNFRTWNTIQYVGLLYEYNSLYLMRPTMYSTCCLTRLTASSFY